MLKRPFLSIFLVLCIIGFAFAQKKKSSEEKPKYDASVFSGLKLRSIGPALTSGRISDIAVNPNDYSEYYLAIASGGVWKTSNSGTTFDPIFDAQGSYSIGCVTIAPSNSNVIWVGSGENNNQRSVAYGDGVYKSTDGGKSWKNMGLKNSEHIGMITIHPEYENIVYVAAYGPLWSPGGDRGIYKSTDGGENWEKILAVSEHTGFNEIHMDPRDPQLLYATAHQRRRHVWTYIDGGPETAIYKSTDGGDNWKKLENGIPNNDLGRIGMDISPANPDVVYAIIKATENGGFYKSTDRGESWSKMSDWQTSGNYYQEIVCDPNDVDLVYSLDTWLHHTEDGGKTFQRTGEKSKHVDNHCIWINPNDTDHWRVGCDGGLYETWNAAGDWHYKPNLPITQFYKVAVDNSEPFYYVYGGTQDNNTQGGPSRTTNIHGIRNSDWFITNGGDGFEPQIDPENPNIVYGQAQYGSLNRFDRSSGETTYIKPQPGKDEDAYRWNWDAPLLISPHNNKRLYFGANVLFRSDDRGDNWKVISPDLTRELDRNKLKVMGRVWGVDAVMKNKSTSIYGNLVALDESPLKEGLLYVGSDDGLIHISQDGGNNWTKVETFPGVPARTYVNMLIASSHNENVVYAAFNNHKNGDFKPYLLKSSDKGKSWRSIAGNLPERGSVYAIAEDHVNKDLLFAGTEFGLFFTNDGGANWTQLKSGLPTIAIRDIAIQKRENDLALASFGRSFYILDDYTPLRTVSSELLNKEAHIFPIKEALLYEESNPMGGRGKSSQGESLFTADNPPFGAIFTYYLKDKTQTIEEKRKEKEKEIKKNNGDVYYPDLEDLRKEDREEKPYLLFVIRDMDGNPVRKLEQSPSKGINRLAWNLRYAPTEPIKLSSPEPGRYSYPAEGQYVLPGKYTVEIHQSINGNITKIHDAVEFSIKPLNNQTLLAKDRSAVLAFQNDVAEFSRSVDGSNKLLDESENRLKYIKKAIQVYHSTPVEWMPEVKSIEDKLYDVNLALNGDRTLSSREFETKPGINGRVGFAYYNTWYNTTEPTGTAREQLKIAKELYPPVKAKLDEAVKAIKDLENKMDEKKVPYTPGRDENWKEEMR
ncbi:glycosyl hydrolase [Hyphobacterium sp. CCMP332]|nr:glycosyl hydrolase [Hyphobacterium sp. CCMP332]